MNNILKFILSFVVSYFIVVYTLQIPSLLTNNNPIIKEIYYTKAHQMLPLDFLLIIIYIWIAKYLLSHIKKKPTIKEDIVFIAIITAILTALFCYYFRSSPVNPSNIFSRWFHSVGYRSVIYDIIIVCSVYILYTL